MYYENVNDRELVIQPIEREKDTFIHSTKNKTIKKKNKMDMTGQWELDRERSESMYAHMKVSCNILSASSLPIFTHYFEKHSQILSTLRLCLTSFISLQSLCAWA